MVTRLRRSPRAATPAITRNRPDGSGVRSNTPTGEKDMKYGIAWLLGVPISILVVVYLVSHIF